MSNRRLFLKTSALLCGAAVLNPFPAFSDRIEGIIEKKSLDFLKSMLSSPSPSGYEQPVQKIWSKYTRKFADVSIDSHGNTTGAVNPGDSPRLMFAGTLR